MKIAKSCHTKLMNSLSTSLALILLGFVVTLSEESPIPDYETIIEINDKFLSDTISTSKPLSSPTIEIQKATSSPVNSNINRDQEKKQPTSASASGSEPKSGPKELSASASSEIDKRQQQQVTNDQDQDEFLIGLGLADITGPAADVNLVSLINQLTNQLDSFFGVSSTPPSPSPNPPSLSPPSSLSSLVQSPLTPLTSILMPATPRRRQQQLSQPAGPQQQQPQQPQPQPQTPASGRPAGGLNTGVSELDNNNFRLFNNLIVIEHPSFNELTQIKMGYAKPSQDASGIHLRQFSRSVIAVDKDGNRLVYSSLDNGMIGTLLRSRVMTRLAEIFGQNVYNERNVMMSATHTHSGPGGFFQYMLYNIPSAGFVSQTLEVLVNGTVESIKLAHQNLQPARVYYSKGDLMNASINRSPLSYQLNPSEERQKYQYDTDKTMHLLKFVNRDNKPIGVLNWFAVHATSMNNTNHLISSDNKGAAAIFLEQDFNPPGTMPGQGKDFIAIFAQANEGDVSPNTAGPRCVDTGLPCDPIASTCGNPPKNELCIAFGPGRDMFESTKIIAHHQYKKARELMFGESVQIKGSIKVVHEHIDMTDQEVPRYKEAEWLAERLGNYSEFLANETYHTCQAALGYSFAAGTTDGPGAFDFRQGRTQGHSYWNVVRDLLRRPSSEQIECHKPKPILLDTGEMDFPYTWHPRIVPTQLFKWGQLAIVALPGEFTTMAGRRIKSAVESQLPNHEVVLSGLSNIYTSYIATLEEYALQRYEGASTLYGPHTLQAYVNQFSKLSSHLKHDIPINSSLTPPDLSKSLFSLRPGVIYDGTPRGRNFGDVLKDVQPSYRCGQVVNVTFVSANPRNDPRAGNEGSFLKVERYLGTDANGLEHKELIATDASWDTKFIWQRTNTLKGSSRATIVWETPVNCTPGHYIIRHFGAHKTLLSDTTKQFTGVSSVFQLKKQEQVNQ